VSQDTGSNLLLALRPMADEEPESSRAEMVYKRVVNAIQSGALRPGQRIREAELAKALNVSRTPIREAMHKLTAEGLVVAGPSRGLAVVELDEGQVQELYFVRSTLEGAAARLAAQYASANEIGFLRRLLDDLAQTATPAEAAESNRVFHKAILQAARNQYLTRALTQLSTYLALLPSTTFELPGRREKAHEEHRKIVDAIEKRDPQAAEQAAREHIEIAAISRFSMMFETPSQKSRKPAAQRRKGRSK
jgi:DNA-binding GntR family transcriptional regulator